MHELPTLPLDVLLKEQHHTNIIDKLLSEAPKVEEHLVVPQPRVALTVPCFRANKKIE
jgi:hypothetical protein